MTVTFLPQQMDTASTGSAFAALADLAQTATTRPETSPWMAHGMGCRCTLCR